MIYKCTFCNQDFTPKKKQGVHLFCSILCRKRLRKQQAKINYEFRHANDLPDKREPS